MSITDRPPSGALRKQIRQTKPFANPQEEAFLNLVRTSNLLTQGFAGVLKPHGLTQTQYNALRILRGAHPEPLTCGDVGRRMITLEPDVTRLLDRLESAGLVERSRSSHDRRVVESRITDQGIERLAQLDAPVVDRVQALLGHLSVEDVSALTSLLERARLSVEE